MTGKTHDVIVIGSGAAGSFAALGLVEQGLDVLLLEAGRSISHADFPTDTKPPHPRRLDVWPRISATLTGSPMQARAAFYTEKLRHLFVSDRDHPYTTDKDAPFLWIRGRQIGGRLHTFGRVLMRWSDGDFKAASRDGYGEDWPIAYADLAPFYTRAEATLGVRGCPEGIASIPDGDFAGPAKLTEAERDFKTGSERVFPDRRMTPWRYMPPNTMRVPVPLLAALESGRLTVRHDAIARRVLTDSATGRATGVEFADRLTRGVETAQAGAVMVCASAIESVRLLLNSAGGRHARGIGNNTGNLGRYFMDQVPSLTFGQVPAKMGSEVEDSVPADPFYGVSGGVYIPRWDNVATTTNSAFLRGFGFQGTVGRMAAKPGRPAGFGFMGFGEMLPRADNRITLDPRRRDRWGVPLPHIRCTMGENEDKILNAQIAAITEMAAAGGLEVEAQGSMRGLSERGRGLFPDFDRISRFLARRHFSRSLVMGAAIHESGGARMGADPATSVLNAANQIWDAPNVFVTDASSFMTSGTTGTTLTIMALSLRAATAVAGEVSAG